jgi:MFS family permease
LLIGLTASALAFVVFGLATSLWVLFLSRIVQGAGGGTTGVAHAYVSDTVAKEDRARALGWLSAATNAGISIGPAIGSLAAHLGRAAPGYFAAGLCFINVVAAWRWLPETRTREQRAAAPVQRKPVWHAAVAVLANPTGKRERLIWIYGIGMFAFSLMTSMLALWLGARFGINEKSIGPYFVYYGVLSFVMRLFFLGPVVDRLGEVGTMRLGTLLLAVGMLMYPFATSIWMLAFIIPLVPVGTALMFPSTTSLLSHVTDSSDLGTTMGVAQTFAGVARVAAPLLGGMFFQRLGVNAPFTIGGVIVLMVAWVAFRYIRPVVSAEPAVS